MSRGLLRGAAPWLAAGVLVAPALASSQAMASAPKGPSPSQREEAAREQGKAPPRRQPSRQPAECGPDVRFAQLWPNSREVTFHPTTLEEREAFRKLIPALLAAAPVDTKPPPGLARVAESVGFHLEVWEEGQETLWVLREQPGRWRGAGAYVFRTGAATDGVVQVPHPYFDVGTEDIGAGLFTCAPEGLRPRVFMTATSHRYGGSQGETPADVEHPADVAHNPDHLFQEVTDLLARNLPAPRVVQVHGFGTAKKRGREPKLTAVVSAGVRQPTPWARQVSRKLVEVLGEGVRLYPEEVQVLGGTQNAQGRLLQVYGCARFLHLELSTRARKALASRERLARLGRVLFAPVVED